jgi:hypothetical protein
MLACDDVVCEVKRKNLPHRRFEVDDNMKFLSFLRDGGDAIPLRLNGMEEGNCYLREQKSLSGGHLCAARPENALGRGQHCPGAAAHQ